MFCCNYNYIPTYTDSDTLLFIDFRADRMRQIVEALGIKPQFDTDTVPQDLVTLACQTHCTYMYVLYTTKLMSTAHSPLPSRLLPSHLSERVLHDRVQGGVSVPGHLLIRNPK